METERKKFGMEMLPRLHKRLKEEALKRDEPLWAITQEAIARYLDNERASPPPDPDVERLLELKRIGDPSRVAALLELLLYSVENARRALKAQRKKGA